MITTTEIWHQALHSVLNRGHEVAPVSAGGAWRDYHTKELLAYRTVILMTAPIVVSPTRKLSYRFMAAEAAWILSGDNRVSTIAPFNKRIKDFSDDGARFFGAYGPRLQEQLSYVVRTLTKDPSSRQAVIEVWRPQPPETKDTPCTLSWQFLVRDATLHMIATMRSSDLFTGWVYDIFSFSMVGALVLLELRALQHRTPQAERSPIIDWAAVGLGSLHLTAGSQHLYRRDWDLARLVLAAEMPIAYGSPLVIDQFVNPDHLIEHLWLCASNVPSDNNIAFFTEFTPCE